MSYTKSTDGDVTAICSYASIKGLPFEKIMPLLAKDPAEIFKLPNFKPLASIRTRVNNYQRLAEYLLQDANSALINANFIVASGRETDPEKIEQASQLKDLLNKDIAFLSEGIATLNQMAVQVEAVCEKVRHDQPITTADINTFNALEPSLKNIFGQFATIESHVIKLRGEREEALIAPVAEIVTTTPAPGHSR